jgi:hypothetical protein
MGMVALNTFTEPYLINCEHPRRDPQGVSNRVNCELAPDGLFNLPPT